MSTIVPQVSDPVSVRERLLNAAEQVVSRDGVVNLTLDAVAREAMVSKGGLLYHFPSKSALIHAIVERLGKQCELDHAKAVPDEDPQSPGAFTRAYLRARSQKSCRTERPIHTALLAAAGTDPQYLEPMRRRILEWQAKLESDGIDPAIATIVRLAVDGLCLGSMLGIPMPADDMRQRVLDKLLEMTRLPQSTQSKG